MYLNKLEANRSDESQPCCQPCLRGTVGWGGGSQGLAFICNVLMTTVFKSARELNELT